MTPPLLPYIDLERTPVIRGLLGYKIKYVYIKFIKINFLMILLLILLIDLVSENTVSLESVYYYHCITGNIIALFRDNENSLRRYRKSKYCVSWNVS